jgi:squalene-hopene/tetraprenyl-beta-curcumene cyclase
MMGAARPAEAVDSLRERLDDAIGRSQQYAFGQQHPDGYWHAPLEANVGMDAQYIIFNRVMGRRPEATERRLVANMLATQSDDGSWPLYHGGPGHLNTTVEAYCALKLTGHRQDEPALVRARAFIHSRGGLAKVGVFTRTFLCYLGQFPWRGLPAMPVEAILLPPWFPINIYAFASWARETVVPMLILMAQRPQVAVEEGADVGELWVAPPERSDLRFPRGRRWMSWANFFLGLDAVLNFVGRSPWKPLRARALRAAEAWILARQDPDGGWGGIQPPMINCVMALHALGYRHDHPAIARGLEAIDNFIVEHDGRTFFQPCISPTWDTALMAKALLDAGVPADHPRLRRAAAWLIDRQIFKPGDWSVYNPDLEPGGWAFEFTNDWYPVAKQRALAFGINWTLGMQSRNGGFGAFDTNNESHFLNEIPFADMKAMIDPPTEDLTGRLLEMMGGAGFDLGFQRAARARDFLLRTQRANGAWWGRWGGNFIYGTWSALVGLRAIGDGLDAPHIRRAAAWLASVQNADGGWGETLDSYVDESRAGQGDSTPSQTAWAVLGLLVAEAGITPTIERGIAWLLEHQQTAGNWDETFFTGTGFPGHFYLRYWMYRDYFPLMALGQFRTRVEAMAAATARLVNVREVARVEAYEFALPVPARAKAEG